MAQRPYVLLATAVLAEAQRTIGQAVSRWCADWGVERSEVVLEVMRAWEGTGRLPAVPAWRQPWCSGECTLQVAWPDAMPGQMQQLMFGAEQRTGPGPVAQAAGDAALLALARALAEAFIVDGAYDAPAAPPPSHTWLHASGALLVVLQVGHMACVAVLNHAGTARLARGVVPAASLPLAPVDMAALLAPVPVCLPVQLGAARVDLGSLARLEPGDVIRIGAAADHPLHLHAPGSPGAVLFDGYLGKVGHTMALELAPHDLNKGIHNE